MPYKDIKKQKQSQHESYIRNKAKIHEKCMERRTALRLRISNYKSDKGCFFCKENEPVCLDFHHKNPNEKEGNVGNLITKAGEKRTLEEIEKCVVVCSNCHRKLHAGLLTL